MLGLQVDLKQGRMFDGGSDNPYEGVALSQAAAASIALFQRCSLLEIRGREAARWEFLGAVCLGTKQFGLDRRPGAP